MESGSRSGGDHNTYGTNDMIEYKQKHNLILHIKPQYKMLGIQKNLIFGQKPCPPPPRQQKSVFGLPPPPIGPQY